MGLEPIESMYGDEPSIIHGHRVAGEDPGGPTPKIHPNLIQKSAVRLGTETYGPRIFRTQSFNLRIQMTKMPPKYDKAGNMVEEGYERSAQFRHGVLRTDDLDTILSVENYSNYGLTVWDDEAMGEAREDIYIDEIVSQAASNPRVMERLKADLSKVDFIEPGEVPTNGASTMTASQVEADLGLGADDEVVTAPNASDPAAAIRAKAKAAKAPAKNKRGRPKGSKNKTAK